MLLRDLPLFAELRRRERGQAAPFYFFADPDFCPAEILPGPFNLLADAARIGQLDWRNTEYWHDAQFAGALDKKTDRSAVIFCCEGAAIPPAAAPALARSGISTAFYLFNGSWCCCDLRAAAHSAGLLPRLADKLKLSARKALLKYYSHDLIASGVKSYHPELGNCFIAHLPALETLSDGPAGNKDDLLFFEEAAALTAHCGHDQIRTVGLGRSSLWNGYLYFSATDNSDPNTNGRRYRYLDLRSGLPKRLRSRLAGEGNTGPADLFKRPGLPLRPDNGEANSLLASISAEPRSEYVPSRGDSAVLFIGELGLGGAQKQAVEFALGLKQKGHLLRVYTFGDLPADKLHYLSKLEAAAVEISFVDQPHPGHSGEQPALSALEAAWLGSCPGPVCREIYNLATHLAADKPRVLHCFLNRAHLSGGCAALIAGTPRIILTETEAHPDYYPERYDQSRREWLAAISHARRVTWIAESKPVAAGFGRWIGLAEEKFTVIGYGRPAIQSEARRGELRASLGLAADALVLASACRFVPEKRPLRLIRLVYDLLGRFDGLHAVIAGAGPLEPFMRSEIENLGLESRVHLIGILDDIAPLLADADLAVLPSSDESSPNFLIEARLAGLPAVSTAVGAAPDYIRDGVDGFLCEKNDYPAFSKRVLELCADAELRRRFAQAAPAAVIGIKTFEEKIAATLSVYAMQPDRRNEELLCA